MERRNFLRNLLIGGMAVAVMPSLILQKNDDDILDELAKKGEPIVNRTFRINRDHDFFKKTVYIERCKFETSDYHVLYFNAFSVVKNNYFNHVGITQKLKHISLFENIISNGS